MAAKSYKQYPYKIQYIIPAGMRYSGVSKINRIQSELCSTLERAYSISESFKRLGFNVELIDRKNNQKIIIPTVAS